VPDAAAVVRRVEAAATRPLRRAVLRPHQRIEELVLPGDDDADTGHFAALLDGRVVGTASVRAEAAPFPVPGTAGAVWRLRGMATEPALRGSGVGGRVLAAALGHVASSGGTLLWCNARTPARSFYERAGFVADGQPWDEPEIGPHVRMWRRVDPDR